VCWFYNPVQYSDSIQRVVSAQVTVPQVLYRIGYKW